MRTHSDRLVQTLVSAIATENWSQALSLALEQWRDVRSAQLADLVDRIGMRVTTAPAADTNMQPWWVEHAHPYDPAVVSPLLQRVVVRMRSSDGTWAAMSDRWSASSIIAALAHEPELPQHRNWIERLVAILTWPDDPRVSRVLAEWLASHELLVRPPVFPIVYGEIADRLVQLGDVRVLPHLAAFLDDPTPGIRHQRELVERVHAALAQLRPRAADPELPEVPIDSRLEELWRAVGDHPSDLGARGVLGDALVAVGDARGELIALQLAPDAGDRTARNEKRLLDMWWEPWLGPVAAIAVRDGSEFRNGMLEVLRVGYPGTPLRAWAAARGHRELRTVHTVRSFRVPPIQYARFVTSIEHLQRVQVHGRETLLELAALGVRLSITSLEYSQPADRANVLLPSAIEAIRAFAPCAPRLEDIVLEPLQLEAELDVLVAVLPSLFPALVAIGLAAPSRVAARELAARFTGNALVSVIQRSRVTDPE